MHCHYVPGSSSCCLKTIISLLLFLHIANCATIPRNSSGLLQNGYGCTSNMDWLGHSLPTEEDCYAAVNRMYHVEYMVHGPNQYEFVTKGAKPETELPKMQTPRRYTVRKCTLVIALLDVFPDGALPNAPKGPLYNTDVATWRDLKFHADNILLQCVVLRHSAGYRVAGQWESLGVLLLSTESYENRIIPAGVRPALMPTFGLPNILNGSESGGVSA